MYFTITARTVLKLLTIFIILILSGPVESPIMKMKFNFSALNSSNKKLNGYNITGHCGKFLWIRIALLEKLLRKIVEDLQNNARLEDFNSLSDGVFKFQGSIYIFSFLSNSSAGQVYQKRYWPWLDFICPFNSDIQNIAWKRGLSFCFSLVTKYYQKPPHLSTRHSAGKIKLCSSHLLVAMVHLR